jgi:hypothetical protein
MIRSEPHFYYEIVAFNTTFLKAYHDNMQQTENNMLSITKLSGLGLYLYAVKSLLPSRSFIKP